MRCCTDLSHCSKAEQERRRLLGHQEEVAWSGSKWFLASQHLLVQEPRYGRPAPQMERLFVAQRLLQPAATNPRRFRGHPVRQ